MLIIFHPHVCVVLNPKQCLFHLETIFIQWISHWFKLTLDSSTPSRWKDQKTRSWFCKSQMILCWSHWKYVNSPFITSNWLCRTCIHMSWHEMWFAFTKSSHLWLAICCFLFQKYFHHIFLLYRKWKTKKRNNRINPVLEAKLNEKWFVICQNSLALQNNPAQRHTKSSAQITFNRDWNFEKANRQKQNKEFATANEQHQQCRQTFWEFKMYHIPKAINGCYLSLKILICFSMFWCQLGVNGTIKKSITNNIIETKGGIIKKNEEAATPTTTCIWWHAQWINPNRNQTKPSQCIVMG